jgi:hypothetical protein
VTSRAISGVYNGCYDDASYILLYSYFVVMLVVLFAPHNEFGVHALSFDFTTTPHRLYLNWRRKKFFGTLEVIMGGGDLCAKIFRPQLGSVKFLATTRTTTVLISFDSWLIITMFCLAVLSSRISTPATPKFTPKVR